MMKRAVPDRLRVVREGVGAGGAREVPDLHRSVPGRRREMRPGRMEINTRNPVPVALAAHDQITIGHGPQFPRRVVRDSCLRETDAVATTPSK